MAVVTGPLMSLGASGQLGKSMVFASWKGQPYARRHTIPKNPKTAAQTLTRNVFKWLHDQYKFFDVALTEDWKAYAKGQMFTDANAFLQANIPLLRGAANNNDMLFVKPVAGGPPPATITVTPGANKITVAHTAQALPPGWSIVNGRQVIMKQVLVFTENESKLTTSNIVAAPGPYTHDFVGLTTGDHYVAGAFFKYDKGDGTFAFSGQLSGTAIVA